MTMLARVTEGSWGFLRLGRRAKVISNLRCRVAARVARSRACAGVIGECLKIVKESLIVRPVMQPAAWRSVAAACNA
jgi:predicted RNase H-related nuclease YkuK (DUF458 family)